MNPKVNYGPLLVVMYQFVSSGVTNVPHQSEVLIIGETGQEDREYVETLLFFFF